MLVGTARAIKTVAEQITRFDSFVIEIDCLSIVTPELSFEQLTYCSTLAWMSADNKTDWSCQAATGPTLEVFCFKGSPELKQQIKSQLRFAQPLLEIDVQNTLESDS
jgi:hypothetical protein